MTVVPKVLVIGLDPLRVPGPWNPEPVTTAIEAATADLVGRGVDVVNCHVGLDGSDDVPAVVARALGGGPWTCVLVGGGIRRGDGLLPLFEEIVNLVHRLAPEAAIAFNDSLDDIAESVLRRLP